MTGPSPATPRPAAAVILLRPGRGGAAMEVLLVRRHRGASFMADSFVFPGGRVDAADRSPEEAAIRELFEEAGVLLCRPSLDAAGRQRWRQRLLRREAPFAAMLAAKSLEPQVDDLHLWGRWITPAFEPKRFDARFFVAAAPPDHEPSSDQQETVELAWLSPDEALLRHGAGELPMPPPQVITLMQLAAHSAGGLTEVVQAAAARRPHLRPIQPRVARQADAITLLLPWDPDYPEGYGEGAALPPDTPLAVAASRLTLDGRVWRPPGRRH